LEKLANELLEKEVIFKENLEVIFGKRPWDKHEEEAKPAVNGSAKEVLDDLSKEESTTEESISTREI
jgi:cell division protease FtsH